jgi:hypothetical protein
MEAEVTGAFISGILGFVGSIGSAYIALQGKEDTKKQKEEIQVIIVEQKGIVSDLKTALQEVAKSINDPTQREKIEAQIQKLDDRSGELQQILRDLGIWKEASIWLNKNREILEKQAVEDVLKKCDWLRNPGRALDSQEKIQKFKESIGSHIQWIWANLNHGINVPFDMLKLKVISDNDAYRKAFESIKTNITELQNQKVKKSWIVIEPINSNRNRKLSKPAAKILIDFVEFLIKEYT